MTQTPSTPPPPHPLLAGAHDVLGAPELAAALASGRPLRVKLGADPTRPDLHLGHAALLRRLRAFQDAGHVAVLVIGDFTATIGDPTGRDTTRPPLTLEETRANARTFLDQAGLVLDTDPARLEVRHNAEWLAPLGYGPLIALAARVTVQQLAARADFADRLAQGHPIGVHEFLYPLSQAYDSVVLRADIELGGSDQLFNLGLGRDLMRALGMTPQSAVTWPLLVGLDGTRKMSKSHDNAVALTASPARMAELLMRVPDPHLGDYLRVAGVHEDDTQALLAGHPVAAHHALVRAALAWLHPGADADAALTRFAELARRAVPDDVPEVRIDAAAGSELALAPLLVTCGLASSNGEARRAISGRGVRLDGEVVLDPQSTVTLRDGMVLSHGRSRLVRLRAA